jgi:Ser/Thr protein kinase RdoA (MazF antagonist)
MRDLPVLWPPDHPAVADDALSEWRSGAEELCPDAVAIRTLRYLRGRRVATLVRTRDGEAVLKIFASPRARGNHRRLRAIEASKADGVCPHAIAVDRSGHVGLLEFIPGETLDRLRGERLVMAMGEAGAALRRMHESDVALDRAWSVSDEVRQLRRVAGPHTRGPLERVIAAGLPRDSEPTVPSHRDCYPAQAVLTGSGIRYIDADDAAMAPAPLDAANFTAHLAKGAIVGTLDQTDAVAAAEAFLEGYGGAPPELEAWQRLSIARLAGLAETRHRDPEAMHGLLTAVDAGWPHKSGPRWRVLAPGLPHR